MAVQVGGSGGGRGKFRQNSDINVTPMVDVMLVLLIIFMVAAPLATVNIPVDLPPSNSEPTKTPKEPVFVSLQKTGEVYVGDDPVTFNTLVSAVDRKTLYDHEERVMIRADEEVLYRYVMLVLNTLQDAGYLKVAFVTEEVKNQ